MSLENQVQELVKAIDHQTKAINALVECNTKLMTALIDLQDEGDLEETALGTHYLSGKPVAG